MNRLTKPKAQMPLGMVRQPAGTGRSPSGSAVFIGKAFVARDTNHKHYGE